MSTSAQWIAMHRHDVPVDGDWSGFAGVAHAQERILDMLGRYDSKRVLFYEHRPARDTVSVRRVMQGLA
jgi:hypothetical protein